MAIIQGCTSTKMDNALASTAWTAGGNGGSSLSAMRKIFLFRFFCHPSVKVINIYWISHTRFTNNVGRKLDYCGVILRDFNLFFSIKICNSHLIFKAMSYSSLEVEFCDPSRKNSLFLSMLLWPTNLRFCRYIG